MPNVNRKSNKKTYIQSIIFNKKSWNKKNIIQWLKNNNFFFDGIDVYNHITKNYYRFRQYDPDYKNYNYKTKKLNDYDINLIIGFKK